MVLELVSLIAVVIAVAVVMFFVIEIEEVPEAHVMIVERFRTFHRVAPPGLHILLKILHEAPRKVVIVKTVKEKGMEKPVYKRVESRYLDLRVQILDFPEIKAITRENVPIGVDALAFYEIVSPVKAAYRIENIPDSIEQIVQTSLNEQIGVCTFDQAIQSKTVIEKKVLDEVKKKVEDWGIRIINVEIQRIEPPEEMLSAMEAKAIAERKREAERIEAETYQEVVKRKAEGDKEAAITRAEGEKQAAILKAEGEAEATRKLAAAEGEAIRAVLEKIATASPDAAMRYLMAIKYIEALHKIAEGKSSKIFFPVELMGSIDRVSEVLYKITTKKEEPR